MGTAPLAGAKEAVPPSSRPPEVAAAPAAELQQPEPPHQQQQAPVVVAWGEADLAVDEHETQPDEEEEMGDGKAEDPAGGRHASYRMLKSGDAIVDLHGLPMEVARIAVQVALEDLLLKPVVPPRGGGKHSGGDLIIVTGRGKNSPGGIPVVRPAIISLLRDEFRIAVMASKWEVGRLRIPAAELWRLRGVPDPYRHSRGRP